MGLLSKQVTYPKLLNYSVIFRIEVPQNYYYKYYHIVQEGFVFKFRQFVSKLKIFIDYASSAM